MSFVGKLYTLNKYVIKDWIAYMKNPHKKLYGVHLYVGDVGYGKTISAVNYAWEMKKKDDRIKVYTNCHCSFQDGAIEHWSDMMTVDSYSIVIIDEVQNTFNQRNFNSFPGSMFELLTQNRKWGATDSKGERRPPGVQVIFTTQDYENTDVIIRRLCNWVYQCNSLFKGRAVLNRKYHRKEYEKPDTKRKRHGVSWFVATNEVRDMYDTHKILKSMKSQEELELEGKRKR